MKKVLLIIFAAAAMFSCKKEESPMCEVLRSELKYMYENDISSFEENKIEYWTRIDELNCDRREIKSSWGNIQTN